MLDVARYKCKREGCANECWPKTHCKAVYSSAACDLCSFDLCFACFQVSRNVVLSQAECANCGLDIKAIWKRQRLLQVMELPCTRGHQLSLLGAHSTHEIHVMCRMLESAARDVVSGKLCIAFHTCAGLLEPCSCFYR